MCILIHLDFTIWDKEWADRISYLVHRLERSKGENYRYRVLLDKCLQPHDDHEIPGL